MNDTNNTATNTETATETATKHYQCRHIFTDGHRCASPCLRHEHFCYYHHTTRKPIANPQQRRSRRTTFHLPLPEDRSAILQSIGEVLQRIAANNIDPRRAGLLLYGLQIASTVLPKEPKEPNAQPTSRRYARSSRAESPATSQTMNQTVEDITHDPTHGILAPRAELVTPESRPTYAQMLIQHLKNCKPETNNQPQPETWEPTPPAEAPTEPPTELEILPTLQATDDSATPSSTPPKQSVIPTEGEAAVEGPPYLASAVAVPELRNRTIRRPYHSQRSQILINLAPSVTKLVKAVPGELPEIMCRLHRGPANLNRGVRFGVPKQLKHSLHPKMRPPALAFDNALGHHQQLCPRFKCQHRRLIRKVGK